MKDLKSKLKLVDHFSTEIEIQKMDFIKKLDAVVDEGRIDLFSDAFDMFSGSKNIYKGEVRMDGFQIKRKRRFFDMNRNRSVAKGQYIQKGKKLLIETEIDGLTGLMTFTYFVLILVYSVLLMALFSGGILFSDEFTFFRPFMLIHAVFMFGLPYYLMRRNVKKMKNDLEREFQYLANKT